MRQKTPIHSFLCWSLTVAILAVTGVLGCHHSFSSTAGNNLAAPPSETGPTLAPEGTAPLLGSDLHCALCATLRLLNQSCAGEIHDLSVPAGDSAFVPGESTHPTVPGVGIVDARSPPLS